MKILIDGRCLMEISTGIKRYTLILIQSYIDRYRFENVFVLVNKSYPKNSGFQTIIFDKKTYSFWNFVTFHKFLKKIDADIYHFPNHYNSLFKIKGKIYITTIHDIMYKVVPNFYRKSFWKNKLGIIKTDFFIRYSLKNSDIIFSISETTRKDVYEAFGKNSIIVLNGLNKIHHNTNILKIEKLNLQKHEYFLYVGLTMHHKNVRFLIACFLKANTSKKLVICGNNNGGIICQNTRIIFVNFVDEETLASLYKYCKAFVYPSLYEGFGMPVLEALSFGVPIISSHGGALKEFSPEFVDFFNPKNEKELINLLEKTTKKELNIEKIKKYLDSFDWGIKMEEMHLFIKHYIRNNQS
ncbi:MAG: glycosyltransferase family 4 protein [Chitinophagaceae bacterium]